MAGSHQAFADFSLYRLIERFEEFSDDLSNWYLRRSRRRFWKSESDLDKMAAYQTLHETIVTVVRVMAPVLPFLCEEIYRNLVVSVDPEAPESVHLTPYPAVVDDRLDPALEARIEIVIRTKNLGLALRSASGVKTRQPLGVLHVRPRDDHERSVLTDPASASQVLEECNVKEIALVDDAAALVETSVRTDRRALGPRYGKQLGAIEKHLATLDPVEVAATLGGGESISFEIDGTAIELVEGDVELVHRGPDHLTFHFDTRDFVALDTTITPVLEAEGCPGRRRGGTKALSPPPARGLTAGDPAPGRPDRMVGPRLLLPPPAPGDRGAPGQRHHAAQPRHGEHDDADARPDPARHAATLRPGDRGRHLGMRR